MTHRPTPLFSPTCRWEVNLNWNGIGSIANRIIDSENYVFGTNIGIFLLFLHFIPTPNLRGAESFDIRQRQYFQRPENYVFDTNIVRFY